MKIYQHVDELNEQDGIGNDIRGFHSLLKNWEFKVQLLQELIMQKIN